MEPITKKHFKALHKTGKLSLLTAVWNKPFWDIKQRVETINLIGCTTKKTTKVNIDNIGDYIQHNIHRVKTQDIDVYYVETTYNNAKCNTTSNNDIKTCVIIYLAIA